MKRSKKHRVKEELPETSTSRSSNQKEHDLAYYIHDRVELMHQVFSVLKHKEIKSMAPGCVRHISISDLQELCMEELLGISSKRLCAILDGATPPSDTESSSESEQLETISLDSISSDDEILSQISTKKKHKHRSKSKSKKNKSKDKDDDDQDKDQADRSRRAGLTVLELLELQARARAIRAQLQQEQATAVSTGQPSESVTGNLTDDEVEIKEEAAEVVEISSEDEKPNVQELQEKVATRKAITVDISNSTTVTKKVNDLVITVPKTNNTRKIKLKRKPSTNVSGPSKPVTTVEKEKNTPKPSSVVVDAPKNIRSKESEISNRIASNSSVVTESQKTKTPKADAVKKDKSKSKDKKKKRKKDKQNDKDGSDHDEIMLQLSDTEKMDLLEDLEGKKPEKRSDTEDSSSDSSGDESVRKHESRDKISGNAETRSRNIAKDKADKEVSVQSKSNTKPPLDKSPSDGTTSPSERAIDDVQAIGNNTQSNLDSHTDISKMPVNETDLNNTQTNKTDACDVENSDKVLREKKTGSQSTESDHRDAGGSRQNAVEASSSSNILVSETAVSTKPNVHDVEVMETEQYQKNSEDKEKNKEKIAEELSVTDEIIEDTADKELASSSELISNDKASKNETNKSIRDLKSEGELSDRDSSEVEASDVKPDVVCISDDEDTKGKKKKKKDKKSKKDKKTKKKKDFRESADQNFYSQIVKNLPDDINCSRDDSISKIADNFDSSKRDNVIIGNAEGSRDIKVIGPGKSDPKSVKLEAIERVNLEVINADMDSGDDVYEILELSDDSSCYEVEEISISKEPTAREIEALSAKLDELERDRVIDDEEVIDKETDDIENVSWKDRYLKSSKVKKVLTTSNLMNAMRKKNLELKKKLQESKQETAEEKKTEVVETAGSHLEDGSIEQYYTLEASTKYVDPVKEVTENTDKEERKEKNGSGDKADKNERDTAKEKDTVTKEMKRNAKQLLKMYKMLLKYNDMSKEKDPSRKRKKKKGKDKDGNTG